ncbi:MAG: hypothetical protein P8P99_11145 [Maricaulis sp.]|jgi:hypothetical protein|nr:hypothetical protein [Maricaulis sp.]
MASGDSDIAAHSKTVFGKSTLAREALLAANVNPETGLATDYLNHFNEVVMLMEMLPDMHDCIEDILEWEQIDYCTHFERSGLKGSDVAILAYHTAPHALKAHLETLVLQIGDAIQLAKNWVCDAGMSDEIARKIATLATDDIKPLIAAAGGAIHGEVEGEIDYLDESIQAEVDSFFDGQSQPAT